jgi:DNA polymerase-3 subunit gamma/tau
MAYQALARKWRPRNFSEIVGQDHVVRALTHALEFDRLHHAYLFTGTRGVGKTTIARILAKAMNCESLKGADPCGLCQVCRELDEGRFVDLVEVDAASRTKVEDTRELLDNVLYAPSQGRYKVYLIDEVHMLSAHSFNALLKTLEEPPPHVKFLLATTDPQKIPVTVLSRCLQFNLKRLTPDQIRGQMETILHQEAISFEANAIKSLARAADGSLRDGLSLMDQAIVHGGGSLSEATVTAMLGTVARSPIFELLEAVIVHDAPRLLEQIDIMAERAPDFGDVLQQLLVILHHAALAQWAPEAVRRDDDADRILALAESVSQEDIQLFYQIGLIGQRDLPLAPDLRCGFEMVMLRMLAFRPTTVAAHTARGTAPDQGARPDTPARPAMPVKTRPITGPELVPMPESRQSPVPPLPRPAAEPPAAAPVPAIAGVKVGDWPALIRAMGLTAMTRELANNCVLQTIDESSCVLSLEPRLAHLRGRSSETGLEKALQSYFNRPVALTINMQAPAVETPATLIQREREDRQRSAETDIEQDETVRALKQQLGARIIPGSIKPI